jgi:hypothetical protein
VSLPDVPVTVDSSTVSALAISTVGSRVTTDVVIFASVYCFCHQSSHRRRRGHCVIGLEVRIGGKIVADNDIVRLVRTRKNCPTLTLSPMFGQFDRDLSAFQVIEHGIVSDDIDVRIVAVSRLPANVQLL